MKSLARRFMSYLPARIPQKWAPVLRSEYAHFIRVEHFLAANRIPLRRKVLVRARCDGFCRTVSSSVFAMGSTIAGVRLYRKAGDVGETAIARDDLSRKAPALRRSNKLLSDGTRTRYFYGEPI
jgi:hypothetical protein